MMGLKGERGIGLGENGFPPAKSCGDRLRGVVVGKVIGEFGEECGEGR